jgi:carbon storage regulator CsrA
LVVKPYFGKYFKKNKKFQKIDSINMVYDNTWKATKGRKMLVLSRKKDEEIILKVPGLKEDIRITVVIIDNRNKVRLGIQAQKEVTVLRSELETNVVEIDSRAPTGQISAITSDDDDQSN